MNKKELVLFFVKHYLPHKKATLFSLFFVSLLSFSAYHLTLSQSRAKAMEDLDLLLELRHAHLSRYFSSVYSELSFWSEHGELRIATEELSYTWQKEWANHYLAQNPYPRTQREKLYTANNGNDYDLFHNVIHHLLRPLTKKKQGYADILLINTNADIMYSVKKHPDYGQNLRQKNNKNSPLKDLYYQLSSEQQTISLSKALLYSPADYRPLLFVGKNMYHLDGGWLGVLVFAIPLDVMGHIMHSPDIKAAEVDSYIVGQDHQLLTTSFSHPEKILQKPIRMSEKSAIPYALQGKMGIDTFLNPYDNNRSLLTAYRPFSTQANHTNDWALITEKPLDAVHKPSIRRFFVLFSQISLLFLFAFIVSRFLLRWIEGEL